MNRQPTPRGTYRLGEPPRVVHSRCSPAFLACEARFDANNLQRVGDATGCRVADVIVGNIGQTVVAVPSSAIIAVCPGNGSRVVTEDPGRVSGIGQEAVFGGDPLHLADARDAGSLIERKSRRVIARRS